MTTITKKLTTTQREILLHRLAVPDCLGECIGESLAEEQVGCESPGFDRLASEIGDNVFNSAGRLYDHFKNGGELFDLWELSDIEKLTLADVINGSVWIGSMEMNCPESQIVRHYNIGCELARMVSEVVGMTCEFPDC